MRDPVRVLLGKGVQATVERETAEGEGLKLAADQSRSNLWAHGRLRGATIHGEEPEIPIEQRAPIPPQNPGDVAGGEASDPPAKAKPSSKKENPA
jgi:hypothetical protein